MSWTDIYVRSSSKNVLKYEYMHSLLHLCTAAVQHTKHERDIYPPRGSLVLNKILIHFLAYIYSFHCHQHNNVPSHPIHPALSK